MPKNKRPYSQQTVIWYDTPRLDALRRAVRKKSIGLLQLSPRASNALEGQKINFIGDLIKAARNTFFAPHLGVKSIAEIKGALDSLSSSIDQDGNVDWLRYAANRHFSILPSTELGKGSASRFVQQIPLVMEAAVESSCGVHAKELFQQYLFGDKFGKATLPEIARKLGFSRQLASQVKNSVLGVLRRTIFEDDYRGCRFRFRHSFVLRLRELKAALDETGGRAFPYAVWDQILARTWGVAANQVAPIENLLFAIFGYQVVRPVHPQKLSIIVPNGRNVLALRRALADVALLLTQKFPDGLSELQLLSKLQRSNRDSVPLLAEIPTLLDAIPGLERDGSEGKIRAGMDRLTRMSDQLERILRARGVPTTTRELASEVNRFKGRVGSIRSARNVNSALSNDKRFKIIGRTRMWILSEWDHIETRTVAEIAAGLLRQAARPMTESELFGLIAPMRPVAQSSIGTLLRQNGRFRRTAPCTWTLK